MLHTAARTYGNSYKGFIYSSLSYFVEDKFTNNVYIKKIIHKTSDPHSQFKNLQNYVKKPILWIRIHKAEMTTFKRIIWTISCFVG